MSDIKWLREIRKCSQSAIYVLSVLLTIISRADGPGEWIPVDRPRVDLELRSCENEMGGWSLSAKDGRIVVIRDPHASSESAETRIPLLPDQPQKLTGKLLAERAREREQEARKHASGEKGEYVWTDPARHAEQWKFHGYPFANGWLTGYDNGEFGGGVFWLDIQGKSLKSLYHENLIGMVPARDGILILMGSRHLMGHGSAVFLNPDDLLPGHDLPTPYDLSAAPVGAALTRDNNMVGFHILTDNGVREIIATWNQFKWRDSAFFIDTLDLYLDQHIPNSIASVKRGELYIGLQDHILVMKNVPVMGMPWTDSLQEQWYAHVNCIRRVKRDKECVCIPATPEQLKRAVPLP